MSKTYTKQDIEKTENGNLTIIRDEDDAVTLFKDKWNRYVIVANLPQEHGVKDSCFLTVESEKQGKKLLPKIASGHTPDGFFWNVSQNGNRTKKVGDWRATLANGKRGWVIIIQEGEKPPAFVNVADEESGVQKLRKVVVALLNLRPPREDNRNQTGERTQLPSGFDEEAKPKQNSKKDTPSLSDFDDDLDSLDSLLD